MLWGGWSMKKLFFTLIGLLLLLFISRGARALTVNDVDGNPNVYIGGTVVSKFGVHFGMDVIGTQFSVNQLTATQVGTA